MSQWLLIGLLALPAAATDRPAGHGGGEPSPTHGEPSPTHGEPGASGEAGGHGEGGGAGHHVTYTDDDDHDGTPNWKDADSEGYVLWNLGFHAFNFALLVGALAHFVRRPVIDTFRERALGIRTTLTESARKRDEAHQRHQELLARLEKIEEEVRVMEQDAAVDAKREEEKLVERAEREAARIVEQAERNIRDEATRARIELRAEAVELAIQLARTTLSDKVTKKDQQTLAREFLDSLGEVERV